MDKHGVHTLHIMRSGLGRARGLGAAKTGAQRWWAERVTSIALLPLCLYFAVSVLMLAGDDRAQVAAFMAEPWNTVLYLCFIFAMFYHLSMGLQVVVEDYVNGDASRIFINLALKGAIWFCALACAVSVLKLAL